MTSSAPAVRARHRTALAVVLCAGMTAALTACAGEDPDEGTNGVGKLTAEQIEKKTRTAADAADAVRLTGKLVSKGGTYTLNMRLSADGGTGSVTSKKNTFALLRIGDELYLKADADFWAEWAKAHPSARVTMLYLFTERAVGKNPNLPVSRSNPLDHRVPTGTTPQALELERLAKERNLSYVRVVRGSKETTLNHNDVPRTHLANLLKAARYLDDR